MYKQFDVVQILTTKRVRYLSGPKNFTTTPHGNWIVVGAIENELLIAKENTLVKIPTPDVQKVAAFDKEEFFKRIESAGYLNDPTINMITQVAQALEISVVEAKVALLKYNFSTEVKSTEERDEIIKRIRKLLKRDGDGN